MKTLIAAVLLSAGTLVFAQPQPVQKTDKPPVISDTLKAKLFKAEAQSSQAQLTLEQAQTDVEVKRKAFQEVVQELVAACGPKHTAQLDTNGDPVCVVLPEKK